MSEPLTSAAADELTRRLLRRLRKAAKLVRGGREVARFVVAEEFFAGLARLPAPHRVALLEHFAHAWCAATLRGWRAEHPVAGLTLKVGKAGRNYQPKDKTVRFTNPANPDQGWNGRGRRPRWATPDMRMPSTPRRRRPPSRSAA